MNIGIVVLNWNGIELLKQFLPSLVKFSKDHHIYLADNASTDSSVAWTQANYPEVSIIALEENLGYAGGYNAALKQVDEEVFCLLNNDVEVTQGWCESALSVFKNQPTIAALQPKIKDIKNRDLFEYAGAAGGFLDRFAYPYCRGRIFDTVELDTGQYDSIVDLHWASGACLFIRKDVFNKLEGFDERYFAHQEEIDLCWRIRHFGYNISFVPTVEVFHIGGGTLQHSNPKKTFYNFRNSLFNILKNEYATSWIGILFLRMILDGVAALKFLIEGNSGHFVAVFKAHLSFYKGFGEILKSRKNNRKSLFVKKAPLSNLSIVYQYFIKKRKIYVNLNN